MYVNNARRIHLAPLVLRNMADGLFDPSPVLALVLRVIGSPAYLAGLLVPFRESGSLLLQLLLSLAYAVLEKCKSKVFPWCSLRHVQSTNTSVVHLKSGNPQWLIRMPASYLD